jgi:hypothetical protein
LAAPGGAQQCFSLWSGAYFYSFAIPVCGAPAAFCSSFGARDIAQIGSPRGLNNYNLGTYAENWEVLPYAGRTAMHARFNGGTYCDGIGPRTSDLFVLCDRSLSATTTRLAVLEVNCSYAFILQTSDSSICAGLAPLTPAPSPAVEPQSSSPYFASAADSGKCPHRCIGCEGA